MRTYLYKHTYKSVNREYTRIFYLEDSKIYFLDFSHSSTLDSQCLISILFADGYGLLHKSFLFREFDDLYPDLDKQNYIFHKGLFKNMDLKLLGINLYAEYQNYNRDQNLNIILNDLSI